MRFSGDEAIFLLCTVRLLLAHISKDVVPIPKDMLTIEEVKHIAALSRLRLSDEEAEKYRGQLDAILGYVKKLQELDTKGVPEVARGVDVTNVFREDFIDMCDPDIRERILKAFTSRSGDLLQVQAVFADRTE